MSLTRATRSESTKLFTTSIWWLLGIVLVAYIAFTAAAVGLAFSLSASGSLGDDAPVLPSEGLAPTLYSTATSVGYVFPLLLGTLMVTGEFRHKTLTPTFLAIPRRGTVLWAKIVVGVLIGVIYAVAGIVAAVGPAAGILVANDLPTALDEPDTWALFGRMLIAYVLWVLVGIGVGALVRNQVGAIVGVLVFTQFLEPVGRAAAAFVTELNDVVKYLPGAASDALVGASLFTVGMPQAESALEWWVGGLVLLGYAAVALLLGHLVSWRRDVS